MDVVICDNVTVRLWLTANDVWQKCSSQQASSVSVGRDYRKLVSSSSKLTANRLSRSQPAVRHGVLFSFTADFTEQPQLSCSDRHGAVVLRCVWVGSQEWVNDR
jgi:hypothetical protein